MRLALKGKSVHERLREFDPARNPWQRNMHIRSEYVFLTSFMQEQETVFHYVAAEGNVSALKEILSHLHSGQIQLAVNKQSATGWSPLIVASSKGHAEVVMVIRMYCSLVQSYSSGRSQCFVMFSRMSCEGLPGQ